MTDTPKSNPPITPVASKLSKVEPVPRSANRKVKHKLNIYVLLQALKRRWWQAGLLGIVLAAIVGVGLWFLVPLANPLVYARVRILENVGGIWQGHPDPPLQRQTQIALIKDPIFFASVLRRPEVAQLSVVREREEPENWLMTDLRIEFPSGPELMQFSMSGDRPQELKVIVNAVREEYLKNYGDSTRTDRQNRLKSLQDYYRQTRTTIDNLYDNLRKKAESGKDVDKETILLRHKLNMELLEYTRKEITKTSVDLRQYKTELKVAMESTGSSVSIPDKLIDDALNHHPLIVPLLQRYVDVQEIMTKTKQAAPTNPQVTKLQNELVDIQKQIEAKKKELHPTVLAELKNKYLQDRDTMIESMKANIKKLEETEKTLKADADRLSKDSDKLNETTIQLEEERQQIAVLEAVRARLAGAIEQLNAEKDAPERIKPLNDTVISFIDKYSNKIRFSALGSLAAFALALFCVAYFESRTKRIASSEDVLDHFGLNVVGMVPAPPKRLGLSLSGKNTGENAWQHILTESVDSFRTQLLFKAKVHAYQVLMVSSADSGEGKTSLACHLALSLARSGLKTLLVDADLRNPTLHSLFEMPLAPGLSEVIRSVNTIEEAVQRTSAAGLWLLPGGVCDRRVIELLAQDRLKEIFDSLRSEFDFIIVDSSPILPVADPLLVAQNTDGVIFSLMHEVSRFSAVHEAVEKLSALNIHTLGAVINGTRVTKSFYNNKYAYRTVNN